jgi:hypothetical protein
LSEAEESHLCWAFELLSRDEIICADFAYCAPKRVQNYGRHTRRVPGSVEDALNDILQPPTDPFVADVEVSFSSCCDGLLITAAVVAVSVALSQDLHMVNTFFFELIAPELNLRLVAAKLREQDVG